AMACSTASAENSLSEHFFTGELGEIMTRVALSRLGLATSPTAVTDPPDFRRPIEEEEIANLEEWPIPDTPQTSPAPIETPATSNVIPFPSASNFGQSAEDFVTENFNSNPGDWRDLPVTDKQRQILLKGNVFDIPVTRGEASEKIKELIES